MLTLVHPNYGNLLAAYKFDASSGTTADDYSVSGATAQLLGLPEWQQING